MAKLKCLYLEFVYKVKNTKNSTHVPFQVMPGNNVGQLFEFSNVVPQPDSSFLVSQILMMHVDF